MIACPTCLTRFHPIRAWQKFCTDQCRKNAAKESRAAEYVCTYCGLLGETIDHVPPKSIRNRLVELDLANPQHFREVRSCRECNSIIGARPPWTVSARRRELHKILKRRYAKYLEMPNWTEEEIEELGPGMQESVREGLVVKALTQARIAWTGTGKRG